MPEIAPQPINSSAPADVSVGYIAGASWYSNTMTCARTPPSSIRSTSFAEINRLRSGIETYPSGPMPDANNCFRTGAEGLLTS